MSQPHRDAERLPEDAAHRLLARAVEIDNPRSSEITIAQLREAAAEAGISSVAFDEALAELRGTARGNAYDAPTHLGPLDRVRQWIANANSDVARKSVLRNLVAIVGFWGTLMVIVSVDRALDVHWLVRKASDPLALGLGAALASRLRARPVCLVLAGLAISQGAEFVMDLSLGAPAVQGFGSHIALMIAGVAGVLLGGRILRQPPAAREVPDVVRDQHQEMSSDREPPPMEARRALTLRFGKAASVRPSAGRIPLPTS